MIFDPVCDVSDTLNHVVTHDHVAYTKNDWSITNGLEHVPNIVSKLGLPCAFFQNRRRDSSPDDRPILPGILCLLKGAFGQWGWGEGLTHVQAGLCEQAE